MILLELTPPQKAALPLNVLLALNLDATFLKDGRKLRKDIGTNSNGLIFILFDTVCCCYSWLYTLYLAMDACFKLKLKNRRLHDPDLGTGWSYFVEDSKYQTFLNECADRKDDKEVRRFNSYLLKCASPFPEDKHLRVRTPRCQLSLHEVLKELLCNGCLCCGLLSAQPCSKERCYRSSKG